MEYVSYVPPVQARRPREETRRHRPLLPKLETMLKMWDRQGRLTPVRAHVSVREMRKRNGQGP